MSGTYKIDGALFLRNPLTKTWERPAVGTHGTNEPIHAGLWRLEMSFGWLEAETEMEQFMNKFIDGGTHTAQLPHPQTGVLTGFTGVFMGEFSYDFNEYERNSYAIGGRMVLERINLGATGTV